MQPVKPPCHWEGEVTELHHRLLLEHDYAIINPLQVESVLWSDLPVTPLVPKPAETRAALMPRLLHLDDLSDGIRDDLLERARRHGNYSRHPFLSALLVADTSPRVLAAQLAQRLILRMPDGDSAFFRYFDPRVFHHLQWVLNENQMAVLMGHVVCWTWRDSAGSWQRYPRPEATIPLSTLRVDFSQWGALQRMALLNRALENIEQNLPGTEASGISTPRVDALLVEASRNHGLASDEDRLLYVVQAATLHPAIHCHPQIVQRLACGRGSSGGYVGACRDLDSTTLRRFVTELTSPSRTLA